MSDSRSLESVFHLVHMLKREMYGKIESLDLNIAPMHVRVLKIIGRKSVCTAIDIAHFLERDKAQVTRLLNSLIGMDLIKKVPNPEDKRSQRLLVSEKGAEILKQIRNIDEQIAKKLSSDITDQEMAEFQRIAEKMAKNLGR